MRTWIYILAIVTYLIAISSLINNLFDGTIFILKCRPFQALGIIENRFIRKRPFACDAYLLFLSTINGSSTRAAIRSGWLSDLRYVNNKLSFRHVFVVGHEGYFNDTREKLSEEMKQHKDILLLPFMDSYWNLTVKVSLMLKWPTIVNQCRYIVKLDEDVYVRAQRFTNMIRNLPIFLPIYGGYYYDQKKRRMPVNRTISDKFSFTYTEFSRPFFDPYVGGPIYFISNTVALRLPYSILRIPRGDGDEDYVPDTYLNPLRPVTYRLEDVYMGSIIGRMKPAVVFWHIPKLITEYNHPRQKDQIALHRVKNLTIMRRGKEHFG
jgi:hypothetical protein